MPASLYLIPVTLGETPVPDVIPSRALRILKELRHFAVEDLRTARRYLRKAGVTGDLSPFRFYLLNEHSSPGDVEEMLRVLGDGQSMGILSEAGLPAVADPGADLVAMAHGLGIRVVPLSGPSSIFMALMASGMNGQSFRFHGYLPVKSAGRIGRLRRIEKTARESGETQIFMEAPYRNMQLLEDLLKHCMEETMLCVAADISLDTEFIRTRSIRDWRKEVPSLHKRPAVFLIGTVAGKVNCR